MNTNKKVLVAYFSCTETTKALAESLVDITKADIFEIRPEIPYTAADLNWEDKKSRSTIEMNDKTSRPAIAGKVPNMDEYDVVFLGFPIWWYVAPTIINTFLESYDFSGKTIVPFCTSGSSGLGNTEEKLHALCPDSVVWRHGKRFSGNVSKDELTKWVEGLDL